MRLRTAALVALTLSLPRFHSARPRPGDILGRWQGTSICIRAEWNSAFSPDSGTWAGAFANSRVRIRRTYRLRNDTLFGVVLRLPGRQAGRRVVAARSYAP